MGFLCNCFYLHITFWSSKKSADKKGPFLNFYFSFVTSTICTHAYLGNWLIRYYIQVRGSFPNMFLKTQMVQFFRNSFLRHFKNCHDAAECSLNYKMLWSLKSEKGLLLCFCNWMVRLSNNFSDQVYIRGHLPFLQYW